MRPKVVSMLVVVCASVSAFAGRLTMLSPRQPMTAVPYAL